jgi:hypothetical protein
MSTLKYVGVPPQWDSSPTASQDLVDVSYINQLLAQNMSMQAANTQIAAQLAGFATQSWANSQYTNLVTPAIAASQVATYQPASTIGAPSGPVALQYGTGQINPAQISAPSTQTFPSPFWSPASYTYANENAGQPATVGVGNSPVVLFTVAIPAQSYSPYVLMCLGSIDTTSTVSAYTLTVVSGTEGTFTLSVGGVTTATIAYNATASTIQTAMAAALGTVASGIVVTGSGPFAINFSPTTGGVLTVNTQPGLFGTSPVVSVTPTGQPVITVQTPANQVIATGYGSPANYQGVTPGGISSQMVLNATSTITSTMLNIGGWIANNAQGFTTTITGNYLQCPQSGLVTITASVTFSGADMGYEDYLQSSSSTNYYPETVLQLVNSSGTILGTGTPVYANSGVATVTWTGTVSQGELIAVQGYEPNIYTGLFGSGAGTYGSWTAGTVTLVPQPPAQNSEEAILLPTPLSGQTPLTGATTLTVYLGTVNNAGGATATTLDPALWIMPIPWHN